MPVAHQWPERKVTHARLHSSLRKLGAHEQLPQPIAWPFAKTMLGGYMRQTDPSTRWSTGVVVGTSHDLQ
jgi:hypothetical protein